MEPVEDYAVLQRFENGDIVERYSGSWDDCDLWETEHSYEGELFIVRQ